MIKKKILFGLLFSTLLLSCEKFDSTGEGVTVELFDIDANYDSDYYFPFVYKNDIHVIGKEGELLQFDSKERSFKSVANLNSNSYFNGRLISGIVEVNGNLYFATETNIYSISSDFETIINVFYFGGIKDFFVLDDVMYVNLGDKIYISDDGIQFTPQTTPVFISQIINYNDKLYGISSSGIYVLDGEKWVKEITAIELVSALHSYNYDTEISGFVVNNDKFVISYRLNDEFHTIQCSESFQDIEIKTDSIKNVKPIINNPSKIIFRSFILNNDEFFNLPFMVNEAYYDDRFLGYYPTGSERFSTGGVKVMLNPDLNNCIGAIQFQNQIITYNIEKNKVVIITGSK